MDPRRSSALPAGKTSSVRRVQKMQKRQHPCSLTTPTLTPQNSTAASITRRRREAHDKAAGPDSDFDRPFQSDRRSLNHGTDRLVPR